MTTSIPCVWNGIPYIQMSDAAEAVGVSRPTMYSWIRKGYTCNDDVPNIDKILNPPQYEEIPGEIWKPILGYENLYSVSNLGRFIRTAGGMGAQAGRMLTPVIAKTGGYLEVGLTRNNQRRRFKVHRLVLEAFRGPCPEDMEACHNNGDRTDNRIENLRWDTKKRNMWDKRKHDTVSHKLTQNDVHEIRKLLKAGLSHSKIAKQFGVCSATITLINTGSTWSWLKEKAG